MELLLWDEVPDVIMPGFRKRPRAQWHDYSMGIYFITICIHGKQHYFGKIVDGNMEFSDAGKIALDTIIDWPKHHTSLELHNFVIMPNHIHVLCQIVGSRPAAAKTNIGAIHEARHPNSDEIGFESRNHHNAPLSTAIGGLKSAVSRKLHEAGIQFKWQSKFHDHIVRDQHYYDNINQYINENPLRWGNDVLNEEAENKE